MDMRTKLVLAGERLLEAIGDSADISRFPKAQDSVSCSSCIDADVLLRASLDVNEEATQSE